MPANEPKPAGDSFVELLRQQIDYLENEDYEYSRLEIYTAGSDEPWRFEYGSILEIDEEKGLLVARDGPVEDYGNDDVPEYVIRLNAIVGSLLA